MLIVAFLGAPPGRAAENPYELEVIKSQRLLRVKFGDKVEKTFRIASGTGGKGDKRKLGDHKTPVGVYRIVKLRDSNRFHIFMQLNYPNVKDAYWGLKNNLITRTEFDAIVGASKEGRTPPQDTVLGGAIGIHGIGEINQDKIDIHDVANWTEGCIALTNSEVDELRRYVGVGTKVVINE